MGLKPQHVFFAVLVGLTILQRLIELQIARRNTVALKAQGGIEFGRSHYWLIILLHSSFFAGLVTEYVLNNHAMPAYWPIPLAWFFLGQAGRVWVIRTMNGRWTTRVIVAKGEKFIKTGPFRLLPHPKYTMVAIELLALPLIFGLYVTATIFSILNAFVLLSARIPAEKRALEWAQSEATH